MIKNELTVLIPQYNQINKYEYGDMYNVAHFSLVHNSNYNWVNFANNFNGVCIEFEHNIDQYNKMSYDFKNSGGMWHKVKYSDNRLQGYTTSIIDKSELLSFERPEDIFTVKDTKYTEEKEIRYVKYRNNGPENIRVYLDQVKRIYLGSNISSEYAKIISDFCKTRNIEIIDYTQNID